MLSDNDIKIKIKKLYSDLEFIKRLKKYRVELLDIELGLTFICTIKKIMSGKACHYKKQKSFHNLPFDEVSYRLSNKLPHLKLLKYTKFNDTALFLDKEYGEFSANFKNVFNEKTNHISRQKNISNEMSIEELNNRLSKKNNYLTIITFNGVNNEATFLDKEYGEFSGNFSSVFHGKIVHNKRRKDNIKKAVNSEKSIEKKKKTNLQRYGVENVFSSEEIKDKIKITNLEKYGNECAQKSNIVKEKTKQTFIKKYGGYPSQNDNVKIKIRDTYNKNYGSHPLQNKLNRKNILKTKIDTGIVHNIDGYCASEYYKLNNFKFALSTFHKNINSMGINNAINFDSTKTNIENVIINILNKYKINYIFNKEISGKIRPDLLIETNKLIIECDGLYYHSDGYGSRDNIKYNKNWHKERQEKYKKLGYRSLFFRSDEILNKTNIVESIILAKLGSFNDKIFARKTKIIELNSKTASAFFEENHLMGRGKGQCYALTYEDKLVSAIRIIKKKDYIDISRFCSAINTNVIGGLGKLLKHIIREHNPQKIISFVDMRYGDGHSLEKLGFVEKTNHVSFKWTDFKQTFHRMNFRGNSGYEKGLFKIWDCGQKKFEFIVENSTNDLI